MTSGNASDLFRDRSEPPKAAPGERRQAERYEVRVRLDAHALAGSVSLEGDDASRTGVFVSSPHAPQPGFALHVTIHLPEGPLEAIGTVVRVEPGRGFGMRLSIPWSEGRTRWWHYLDSLSDAWAPVRGSLLDEQEATLRGVDPRQLFDYEWTNDEA